MSHDKNSLVTEHLSEKLRKSFDSLKLGFRAFWVLNEIEGNYLKQEE